MNNDKNVKTVQSGVNISNVHVINELPTGISETENNSSYIVTKIVDFLKPPIDIKGWKS